MRLAWMRVDAQGRESRTLFFCTLAFYAVWAKYLLAGLTLPVVGTVPTMTATEFGLSVAAVLSPWLTREWLKKGD